jgi:protein arginine kinase
LADSESLVGFKEGTSLVCLVDCEDHLSLRISSVEPERLRYEGELREAQREIDGLLAPVRDREFGAVSRSYWDFGEGLAGEILMHLPALEMGGALDQVLRVALSEGWSLEGLAGSDQGSAGALWSLKAGEELEAPTEALVGAALRLAAMEASTLRELAARAGEELLDRGGRAYGLIAKARSLTVGESLEALSDLRLAVLGGYVPGFSADRLGELLLFGNSPDSGRRDDAATMANKRLPGQAARERAIRLRSSLDIDEAFAMPGPFLKTQGGW